MRITIEKVENGWTVEHIHSVEMPTRVVRVAQTREELMSLLAYLIPSKGATP